MYKIKRFSNKAQKAIRTIHDINLGKKSTAKDVGESMKNLYKDKLRNPKVDSSLESALKKSGRADNKKIIWDFSSGNNGIGLSNLEFRKSGWVKELNDFKKTPKGRWLTRNNN